jgi:hypothetical protein
VRTTISLPDALVQNAKQYAAERRTTLSALLEEALRRRLALRTPSSASRFRLHTVRGKLVNRNLDLDGTSRLVELDDQVRFKRK